MKLTAQEFSDIATGILSTLNDQGAVSNSLADLVEAYNCSVQENETLQTKNDELVNENSTLRDNNQKLFMRIPIPQPTKAEEKPSKPDYSYESLFNKGHLKLE